MIYKNSKNEQSASTTAKVAAEPSAPAKSDCALQKSIENGEDGFVAPPPVEEFFVPTEEIPIYDPNFAVEQKRTVVLEKNYDISKLSPKQIWGILLLKLKQSGFITLHTACGEIRDLELKNNVLFVNVKQDYLFSILTNSKNNESVRQTIKQIDPALDVEFVQKYSSVDEFEQNYAKLKNLFGDFLTEE